MLIIGGRMVLKKVLILFWSFWIPSIIVLIMSIGQGNSTISRSNTPISFLMILSRNMMVLVILVIAGYIHKMLAYLFFNNLSIGR